MAEDASISSAGGDDISVRLTPAPIPQAEPGGRTANLWLWALLAVPVVFGSIWLAMPKPNPQTELNTIRQAFAAGGLPETRLRELYARKQALLQQDPALRASAAAQAARDRDARTVDLLGTPLVLGVRGGEITIPRLRIVLGSFDAASLRAHVGRQSEALLTEIAGSVARVDAAQFAGPAGETYLKELVVGALVRGLGVHPGDDYPSTYFESPGRHGVVDVLLPERFSLRPS